jgi:hypothetical protein
MIASQHPLANAKNRSNILLVADLENCKHVQELIEVDPIVLVPLHAVEPSYEFTVISRL